MLNNVLKKKTLIRVLLVVLLFGMTEVLSHSTFAMTREEAEAQAAEKYPLYQEGEKVNISYSIGRSPAKNYRGVYHKDAAGRILINSQYIRLNELPKELQARFDERLNETLRKQYVEHLLLVNGETPSNVAEANDTVRFISANEPPALSNTSSEVSLVRRTAEEMSQKAAKLFVERVLPNIIQDAEIQMQRGRAAFRSRDFNSSVDFYSKAVQLYNQAIEESPAKLEKDFLQILSKKQWQALRDIADLMANFNLERAVEMYGQVFEAALSDNQWQVARDIANLMTQVNPSKHEEMISILNPAEADALYAAGEVALRQGAWEVVRQKASALRCLDKDRSQNLNKRATLGETEMLESAIHQAMQQNSWETARKLLVRLTEIAPQKGASLGSLIEAAEKQFFYEQKKQAYENSLANPISPAELNIKRPNSPVVITSMAKFSDKFPREVAVTPIPKCIIAYVLQAFRVKQGGLNMFMLKSIRMKREHCIVF
ncbi:MAG: hypothetical protein J5654_01645 [Victivallales bacterium]|nr:hypothetical protein [Victivallales bacterium]